MSYATDDAEMSSAREILYLCRGRIMAEMRQEEARNQPDARRVADMQLVLSQLKSGAPNIEDFPYSDFPVVFPPKSYQAKSLTLDERDQMAWVNGLTEQNIPVDVDGPLWDLTSPRHQFLGVPYLLDPDGCEKNCPQCSKRMFVLATIANQIDGFEEGFFGNDFVQVVYLACNECNVLSARNFAD